MGGVEWRRVGSGISSHRPTCKSKAVMVMVVVVVVGERGGGGGAGCRKHK